LTGERKGWNVEERKYRKENRRKIWENEGELKKVNKI
jgi:hypothetical protein